MKRFWKRTAAGLLALCLLAGCAGKDDGKPQGGLGTAPDTESVIFRLTGLDYNDTVATVNGTPVTAQTYLFLLINGIESELAYGLELEEEWDEALKEDVKDFALDNSAVFVIVHEKAAELGVELSAEDEEQLLSGIDADRERLGGEETFQRELDGICVTLEGYTDINRTNYLYAALEEKMEAEGLLTASDREVEDYIAENGVYAAKHILLLTREDSADGEGYVEFSDAQKALVLEQIQGFYDQIMAADDKEAEFDRLMNKYSQDGRDADGRLYRPDGYGCVHSGDMVPEFEAGATALEVGEISPPVQSAYGYHIIMRIPVDDGELRQQLEGTYKFYSLINEWVEGATVETTSVLDQLDPQEFYTALDEARRELVAAASPAP